jgi:hypothetical protein
MAKRRSHAVVITVTFDKTLSAKEAIAEVRDNIHGQFWTSLGFLDLTYPESFKVVRVSAPGRRPKRAP